MLVETVRLVLVGALLVVVPGFLLVQALLPKARLSHLERAYLTLAGGFLLVTLVALFLGFLPHGREGHLSTFASGKPNVEALMLVLSGLLLYVGILRGAYPRLAQRFPMFAQES